MKKNILIFLVLAVLMTFALFAQATSETLTESSQADSKAVGLLIGFGISFVLGFILGTVFSAILAIFVNRPELSRFLINGGAKAGAAGAIIGYLFAMLLKKPEWVLNSTSIGFAVAMALVSLLVLSVPKKQ